MTDKVFYGCVQVLQYAANKLGMKIGRAHV